MDIRKTVLNSYGEARLSLHLENVQETGNTFKQKRSEVSLPFFREQNPNLVFS